MHICVFLSVLGCSFASRITSFLAELCVLPNSWPSDLNTLAIGDDTDEAVGEGKLLFLSRKFKIQGKYMVMD